MRLVLDTSVLISAIRSSAGASRALLDAALKQKFELLLSVPLLLEYEDVLMRHELQTYARLTHGDVEILLGALLKIGTEVDLDEYAGPYSNDPDDNHVLSLASQGNADAIVTFNRRDFEHPTQKLGINLLTPAEALHLLRS